MTDTSEADDAFRTWWSAAGVTRPFGDRMRVSWEALYRTPGADSWLRCRVIDLSTLGAGLLLIDDANESLSSVVVELSEPSSTYGLVLSGEVRHNSLVDGQRRIGIEFVDIGPIKEWALRDWIERDAPDSRRK